MGELLQYWRLDIDRERLRAHRRWAEKRQGPGRIDLEGKDLRRMPADGAYLVAARFVRCDLGEANFSLGSLDELELEDCRGEATCFARAHMCRARIREGAFPRVDCRLTRFDDAEVQGGDWSGARFDRAHFEGSRWTGVTLRGAAFWDATVIRGHFVDCDLRDADLSLRNPKMDLCRTYDAVFERCDLRHVKWEGRRLGGTRFIDCKMYGGLGAPVVERPVSIVGADMSEAGDASRLVSEADVLAAWRG